MENKNTTQGGIRTVLIIFIIFGFIFCMLKCKNSQFSIFPKSNEIDLRYSNDSIRIQFEKQKLVLEKLERSLELVNKELLTAHNNSQVSEMKLYDLQKKFKRPAYVPELQPCNDSIQVQYKYSVQKDSACNETIEFKNTEIDKLNIKVHVLDTTKINLTNFVKTLEAERIINKKQTFVEKNKKTFWQVVSGVLAGTMLYLKIK